MSKSDESVKDKERIVKKSPVAIAKEAIEAGSALDDKLPPSISLDGVSSGDVVAATNEIIMKTAFNQLQQNTVKAAALASERNLEEEQRKLAQDRLSATAQSPPLRTMSSPGIAQGGLLNPMLSTDRAALLDAALKNLQTDEAKLDFMSKHPELLSTSPLPFTGMQSQSPPVSHAPPIDGIGQIQAISDMLSRQMLAGMDIQKAISMPSQVSQVQSPPVEIVKVVETFKEIADQNTKAFTELFKNIQEQNRASQESAQKAMADLQQKNIELQMDIISQDRMHMKDQLDNAMAQLRQPPQVPVSQLREMIQQAKDGGVPVTMDTPEAERIRAEIAREDKKLDHQLRREEKEMDLALIRERRRSDAISSVGGMINGIFESQALKKHQLSSAGASVAQRF